MASIFVQIPSYHDYEISNTIKDAIKKSSGDHIINFGIHITYFNKIDFELPNIKNVKYSISKGPENLGIGIARYLAHKFYSGEDYYFQVDAHSRFDQNWDIQLINNILDYQIIGIEKPLITNYPKSYWYEDDKIVLQNSELVTQIDFSYDKQKFIDNLIPSQTAVANPSSNIFSNSISGGSIFTVGEFIVPNKKTMFWGEEILIAASAYTNGFDLMVPHKPYMYHLYFDHKNPEKNKRRHVWSDFGQEYEALDKISKDDVVDILTNNKIGPGRLGNRRTLQEYEVFCGLDFKNRSIKKDKCE
jgi:hypothetical protein